MLLAIGLAGCSGSAALRESNGEPDGATDAGDRTDATPPTACGPSETPLAARVLASGGFTGLALTGDGVIVTRESQVERVPLDGGPPTTLADKTTAYGLIVVGGKAYFLSDASPPGLYAVPLSGGEPTREVDTWFAIDRSTTDGEAIYFPANAGGVTRFALADRTRTTLALPVALIIDAIAVLEGVVYVAAQDLSSMSATNGIILKLPAAGGAPTTLVENIGHPWNLLADRGGLTWVQEGPTASFSVPPRVVRAGLDGRGVRTLVDHGATSLVVDGDTLYVSWGGLSKVPLRGGPEVTLVPNLKTPGLLAVAGGIAAWVDPVSKAKSDPTVPTLATTCW